MRKFFLIIFAVVISGNINAQNINESEVPEAVKTAFNAIYPNAENVEWEAEGAYFEGGVKINDMVTSVLFDANGSVIQTESQISLSDLPAGVSDYISKNNGSSQIDKAAKITDSNGKITYIAEIKGSEYIFDVNGNPLYNLQGDSDSDNKDD